MANFDINKLLKQVNQEGGTSVRVEKGSKVTVRLCPGVGDSAPFRSFNYHYDILTKGRCAGWWDDPATLLSKWLVSAGRKLEDAHPLKQKLSDHYLSPASGLRGAYVHVWNVVPRRGDPEVKTFEVYNSVQKQIWADVELQQGNEKDWNPLHPTKGHDLVVVRGERYKAGFVAQESPIGLDDWETRAHDLDEYVSRTVRPITEDEMIGHLEERWGPVISELGGDSVSYIVKGGKPAVKAAPAPPDPQDLRNRA